MPTIPQGVTPIDLSDQTKPQAPPVRERFINAYNALRGRPFGPGTPVAPQLVGEGKPPMAPRQFQYPPGVNIITPPRREYPSMTPFEQLRNLAALYDVAAMCIATRLEEMQGMEWGVVSKDKRRQQELQTECDQVADFFQQPDGLNDFYAWLGMLLYELFTTDALTIYKRPDQAGSLYSLEAVDGSTIKPLMDERGRTVAYQQIIHGFVESQFRRPSAEKADEELPIYTPRQMIYRPRWARTFTPYGFPPTEWIIMRVNTALRKQTFDMGWFTDGNIPDMIATPPESMEGMTDQIQEFETWFNATVAGNDQARRRVRFVPWNMNFQTLKEFQYNTVLDEWMLRVTCAAYSVPPQELGFTYEVNRATAEMQEAVNERRGLKPLANWLKRVIFDPLIKDDLARKFGGDETTTISVPGQPTQLVIQPYKQVEWQWNYGSKSDELVQAQSDQIYVGIGIISPNEVRTMRFGDVLDGPAPGIPQAMPPPGGGFQMASMAGVKADLRLWRDKVAKASRNGNAPADVKFDSDIIPDGLQQWIISELEQAKTPEEARKVFEKAAAPEVAAQFFREVDWSDYG